jgi:ribosomal protein S17E
MYVQRRLKGRTETLSDVSPDKLTANFGENKGLIVSLVNVPSKKLRNLFAGHITRLDLLAQSG